MIHFANVLIAGKKSRYVSFLIGIFVLIAERRWTKMNYDAVCDADDTNSTFNMNNDGELEDDNI